MAEDRPGQQPRGVTLWPLPGAAAPRWSAIASGEALLRVSGDGRDGFAPLRLDFDFGSGGGFVVARTEVDLDLPESWELALAIRGDAPANTLEFKVADPAGTSVWRWKKEAFALPPAETALRVPGHGFEFAWGPVGGGAPGRVSALEIALVAPPGGHGFVEVAGLRVVDRGRAAFRRLHATSGSDAAATVDGDACRAWRSGDGDAAPALTLELEEACDLGGLVLEWGDGGAPVAFAVELRAAGGAWSEAFRVAAPGAPRSFVPLAAAGVEALRIACRGAVSLRDVALKPYGWSRTPSEFLISVAKASPRGEFPRYLLREQALWTPVASPTSGSLGLLGEDGAVEVGEGGFSLEPSLGIADGTAAGNGAATVAAGDGVEHVSAAAPGRPHAAQRLTWARVGRVARQEEAPLPVPTLSWEAAAAQLDVTAVVDDEERVVVRYRVRNPTDAPLDATLALAARPFQVTPPWQAFRDLGGPRRVDAVACTTSSMTLQAGDRTASLCCWPAAAAAGATCFDAGGVAPWLDRGEAPPRAQEHDPNGMAEAALLFPLRLAPASFADVFVACTPLAVAARTAGSIADGAARVEAALAAWRDALPLRDAAGREAASSAVAVVADPAETAAQATTAGSCTGFRAAFDVATTAAAHVLACRDGAALQPGPRRYTRSWIRDGAIMAAALARAGRCDAAREFVEWYAPYQRDDGFVPCCVDRDGADPLVEHDSHGQLVHAVAETYRFTRDRGFAARHWPACARAAAFVEALRDTRRGAQFATGPRRACFGLLPESVSHEGYLAQPVHAYWDDFWALRGLRDAAFLARELGLGEDAQRWETAAKDLGAALGESVRTVMRERGVETVPASVEWADFDPTAIAGALSLTGGAEFLPAGALARTFDLYMDGFRARRDPAKAWSNYSPYEARIVGALVRLGRRDDANELLDALLADCRPRAWKQWPEILWRDAAAPGHLGDLPHCWIGAEYAIALRTMLVFEREEDGALVVGAGLRREWLDAGLAVRGLPTWWGDLDLEIAPDGRGGYRVAAAGTASPPGGFVAALPG